MLETNRAIQDMQKQLLRWLSREVCGFDRMGIVSMGSKA